MKRFIKFLITLLAGYTFGEFLTQYRLQNESISLKNHTKRFFGEQKDFFKKSVEAGENLASDPKKGKEQLNKLIFPNRTQ